MSGNSDDLYLYHLSLQSGSSMPLAVYGNFSAPRQQEIAAVRGAGQVLQLLRPDDATGKVQVIASTTVFGVIRCMASFRLVGGTRDYLVIGSDSGRISILQFNTQQSAWVKVHEETFGKSGVRRLVPGEYVAVDPRGRAVLIAAIEKQKLVYVLNRDQAANLTISSPLEAHKSNMLTLSVVGLDVGFENPCFAAIEVDYHEEGDPEERRAAEEAAQGTALQPQPVVAKYLTFYELDLGLNHVTRAFNTPIDSRSNLLLTVPGGEHGPGGVLVCAEDSVYYKSMDHALPILRAAIPRRFGFDTTEKGMLITASATHVQKGLFFFLLQSEYGDLYKVTLNYEEDVVDEILVKYFDTIPPSTSLVVLKTGFLLSASESANHYLWQFQGIGDEDDPQPFTSSKLSRQQPHPSSSSAAAAAAGQEEEEAVIFKPRLPTNLALIDEMENSAPILDMRVADLAREYTPQLYTLVGRGPRSALRVLRHGLAVSEMAVSELPGHPTAVWAIKTSQANHFMSYIVVSFVNATIVLSIGETVVEVKDSGLLESTNTLHVALLADDSIVQIHPQGLRHIRPDKRVHEWKTPGKKSIVTCSTNERQVVLALSGGEIVYFELDARSLGGGGGGGGLLDLQRKDMGNDVVSLALPPLPEGKLRANFLAVALYNNTVRILSLDPTQTLTQLAMQALPSQPSSLQLTTMSLSTSPNTNQPDLYLYIGLANGVLMRSKVDESSGSLSDTRKRFLGTKAVKLHAVRLKESNAIVALSSRNWLSYIHQQRFQLIPLSYDLLDHAASFSSEQCPEGIVAISSTTLRILLLERLGETFNQTVLPLRNTPRKLAIHPGTNFIVLLETDHNAYTEKQKVELKKAMQEVESMGADSMDVEGGGGGGASAAASSGDGMKNESSCDSASDESLLPTEVFSGAPHAGEGAWSSSIRLVDPTKLETLSLVSLEENEAAFSMTIMQFAADPEWYLLVGTAQNYFLNPRRFSAAYIHVYRFTRDGTQIHFMHKTQVHDIPLALAPFQKRLAAGVGSALRLYELGKKKLLRKCENKHFPQSICSIDVAGDRLYIGDLCEAFHYCLYRKSTNELEIFADMTAPRYLTAHALLDFDTMAGADKFGNIFLARLPQYISQQFLSGSGGANANDATMATLMNKYGRVLAGAQHKLVEVSNFFVGDTVTALRKATLVPGGSEALIYATLLGSIGVLLPFSSREDVEFFTHLEMHLRQESESASIVGRDHLAYRSYYVPVKNVIDGELCEQFNTHLSPTRQGNVAEELVCTPNEVAKRLEDIRNRLM